MKRFRNESDDSPSDCSLTKKASYGSNESKDNGGGDRTYRDYNRKVLFAKFMTLAEMQHILPPLIKIIVEYAVEPFGIFLFGGKSSCIFSPSQSRIAPLTSLDTGFDLAANYFQYRAVRIQERIYVMHADDNMSGRMVCFDIPSSAWLYESQVNADIFKRYGHALLHLGESRLFVAGGIKFDGREALSDCFVYDTATNTMGSATVPMIQGKSRFASVVYKGNAYIFGGVNVLSHPSATCHVYYPQKDKWSLLASLPYERYHNRAVVANDRIFVMGGVILGDARSVDVDEYNPTTDTWTRPGWTLPKSMGIMHAHYDPESQTLYIFNETEPVYSRRFPFEEHEWVVLDNQKLPITSSSASCI